ncbi:MAG: hypothetical protein OHK0031_10680 [Anaerolineales bacterium]
MNFSDKIDEWIQEAEARPASALTILKLVANRLKDLSARNEELLAENIALQNETRVQEYQKRIVHLEYQLDLLKRRAAQGNFDENPQTAAPRFLLVSSAAGRILRLPLEEAPAAGWTIQGETVIGGEWPRLLTVSADEDLLALFTSGRVERCRLDDVPATTGSALNWEQAALPLAPRAGEALAALMPLARLPLSDFFTQASRRGMLKKTPVSLAESILSKHFLGRGALEKTDQPFAISLAQKSGRLALVSYEGRLAGASVGELSFTMEERLRLTASDFIVAALTLEEDALLICVTQNGKIIARPAGGVEIAKGGGRGQALIPPARLAGGTRFIGALAARKEDRLAALDANGGLRLFSVENALGAGTLPAGAPLLSLGLIPA